MMVNFFWGVDLGEVLIGQIHNLGAPPVSGDLKLSRIVEKTGQMANQALEWLINRKINDI